ncbi:MAG: MraZ N-terminal domain containing protein [Phycisphaerae bacterium]|nr:MraZ N-terminal domain containing protein [Phycisphaerae bacterium]
MLLLTGEYEGTVDEKGRVFISNKLRSQIDCDEHGSNFYLTIGPNGVLSLYPEKYFRQFALAESPGTAAPDEAVVFERMSFALASKVERLGQICFRQFPAVPATDYAGKTGYSAKTKQRTLRRRFMYRTEMDHCQAVLDSLTGDRATDEQTFTSINILAERLGNVRKQHRALIDVEFSPFVQELVEQEMKLAVS